METHASAGELGGCGVYLGSFVYVCVENNMNLCLYTHTYTGPKLAGATSPNATKVCIRRLRLQKLSPLVAT